MNNSSSMTSFPSRIDWWLGLILILLPVFVFGSTALVLFQGTYHWAAGLGSALVIVLYVGLIFPMRYSITDRELIIKHGLVRQRVQLTAIKEVRPTRNPLSSPALSLDRLEISTGPGFSERIMISPADKTGFLRLLAERAGLKADGERLVR